MPDAKLILASASPRRRELLTELLGADSFDVIPSALDEPRCFDDLAPQFQAQSLALFKAADLAARCPGRWILGADTLVALNNRVLHKPADKADARTMLHDLSHTPHRVITGMALIDPAGEATVVSDTTIVHMHPMSAADLDAYLATGEWQGKAGAYGIQGEADRYVDHIDGSFSNVVGLCIERAKLLLKKHNLLT